jgi:lipopolysaccharide transport system permease protein
VQSIVLDHRYRSLLRAVVVSLFKRRQQGSLLGVLWSVLNPILMLIILYAVFKQRMGPEVDSYAVYLLVGIAIYTHFANSTAAAMQALKGMGALAANAVFPKEILVLATVLSRSVEFAVSCLVAIGIALLTGIHLTSAVLWLVPVVLLQSAFALSVSLILSCLYLYLRDIEHIYQVFLRLLFFLTPIFYTMDFIGDGFVRNIVMFNPLTHLAMFARYAILGGDSLVVEMLISLLLVSVMLLLSLLVFRRFEPFIAERV